jgi:hypothetical protein
VSRRIYDPLLSRAARPALRCGLKSQVSEFALAWNGKQRSAYVCVLEEVGVATRVTDVEHC